MGVKVLVAAFTGLIGAALLHIVIILTLPQFTGRDAYTRVIDSGPANRFITLDDRPNAAGLANVDPFLRVAVCHFNLGAMPVRLLARGDTTFWSLAIFDSAANEVFSMTDRTSVDGNLDVLIASPVQVNRIRKTSANLLAQSILVEMPRDAGYAVLRVMVPQPSFEEAASDFLSEAACSPVAGL